MEKKSEKRKNGLEMIVNRFLFCISFDLDIFLTLKKANIFSFFSLNRFFALSLQANSVKIKKRYDTFLSDPTKIGDRHGG
jgi:hypothetical protein